MIHLQCFGGKKKAPCRLKEPTSGFLDEGLLTELSFPLWMSIYWAVFPVRVDWLKCCLNKASMVTMKVVSFKENWHKMVAVSAASAGGSRRGRWFWKYFSRVIMISSIKSNRLIATSILIYTLELSLIMDHWFIRFTFSMYRIGITKQSSVLRLHCDILSKILWVKNWLGYRQKLPKKLVSEPWV